MVKDIVSNFAKYKIRGCVPLGYVTEGAKPYKLLNMLYESNE
jgi:hypothetical protein